MNKGEFPEDPKLKCYIRCQNIVHGFADENGDFNLEAFRKVIIIRGWQEVLNKCLVLKGEDPCDNVFKVVKCSYNTVKDSFNG